MKRSYHSNLAFIDILFNTLLCFVVFFSLALIHMNQDKSQNESPGIEFEAFIMIIATWPGEFGDDIDLYVKDPKGEVIFFRNKNNSLMHLDRDDMGKRGDMRGGEEDLLYDNREIVTIRRTEYGEFVVNAHVYTKLSYDPVPVNIKIIKIRKNKTIADEVLIFDYSGQEKTACRFTVKENGEIININQLPIPLAREIVRSRW